MKRLGLILITFIIIANPVYSQIVEIPDIAFLYALIDLGVDTNEDSLISITEAEAIHYLNISRKNILDMTGIEAFVNLDSLDCSNNRSWHLHLDVTKMTALKRLNCSGCGQTSLDLSNNIALNRLFCGFNGLKSLHLANNTDLEILSCDHNDLTSLDLSMNSALKYLSCRNNDLTNLNISNCSTLAYLDCSENNLRIDNMNNNFALDVTNNSSLEFLYCYNNQFTSLDISNCTELKVLDILGNDLASLDVSNNIALYDLNCYGNQLTTLDVSNNTNLLLLNCNFNQLTILDFSQNINLLELKCSENHLTSINVSNCHTLRTLHCTKNQLVSLDISKNKALWELWIWGMPTLYEVCVWELPFPPIGVSVSAGNSPNIYYKDCDAPELSCPDTLYQPTTIEAISTADGMIYLVPQYTEKDIAAIHDATLESVEVSANSPVEIATSGLENGTYWLYAVDLKGKISEHEVFTILGVNINLANEKQFRIFPNPAKELLIIEISNPCKYSIQITSMNGQLYYSEDMEGTTHHVGLSSFLKGVYLITIRSKDFVTTRKIIKI